MHTAVAPLEGVVVGYAVDSLCGVERPVARAGFEPHLAR
jgi:hypothetical protein